MLWQEVQKFIAKLVEVVPVPVGPSTVVVRSTPQAAVAMSAASVELNKKTDLFMGLVSSYRPTYLRPIRIAFFAEQTRETLRELHEACHRRDRSVLRVKRRRRDAWSVSIRTVCNRHTGTVHPGALAVASARNQGP